MTGFKTLAICGSCFVSLLLFLSGDYLYTRLRKLEKPVNPGIRSAEFDHTFAPNFTGNRVWGGEHYFFATDSLGFADRAPRTVSLQTSAYRVMFLGDSFTEGIGLPFDKTFVGLFAGAVKPKGIEVLNAGVSSYSPRLYYAKLKYFLDRGLKVDELFVFIDISDIQDEAVWDRNGFDWASNPEIVDPYSLRILTASAASASPDGRRHPGDWIAKRFSLTAAAYGLIKEATWGAKNAGGLGFRDRIRGSWTNDPKLWESWGREGLDTCGKYMDKLTQLCRTNHVKLRIAVYPWPQQISAGDLNSIQVKYWERFCAERGIPFLNYFSVFIGAGKNPIKEDYIKGDIHWNAAGHKKVADRLIDFWESSR